MSQNGQTHFKNVAGFAAKSVFDDFGTLCIKGLKTINVYEFCFDKK